MSFAYRQRVDSGRNIIDIDFGVPDGWWGWAPGSPAVAHIAAEAASNPRAADLVAKQIALVDKTVTESAGIFSHVAVWVPDPETGEMAAWVAVEIITGLPADDPIGKYLASVRKPPRERRMKVFEYEVDVFDEYEIGLTAAVRKAYALHGGPVVEEFTFVSFPPNSDEAVRTTFSYTDLNLQQALFVEVAAMLHHLNVKLGHLEAP